MYLDTDELDTQIGMAANLIWTLRQTYESRIKEEATVCIKLAGKWNVEVYPRNQYHSELREWAARDKLADAVAALLQRVTALQTKEG